VPVAGPITYSVNGKQYIAVNAGWNNAIVHGLNQGKKPFTNGPARLVVYALDAQGVIRVDHLSSFFRSRNSARLSSCRVQNSRCATLLANMMCANFSISCRMVASAA